MDENNRNFVLALVLSVMVLFGWQFFLVRPNVEQQQRQEEALRQAQKGAGQPQLPQTGAGQSNIPLPGTQPLATPTTPSQLSPLATLSPTREAALALSPRIAIDTPSLQGSMALKGARIDDLVLKHFKQTVKPDSPKVVLLSPSGSPEPYYAESGWTVAPNETAKVPNGETVWKAETQNTLSPGQPVKLVYDNGEGLTFRRTIAVDGDYMFTIAQEVENKSGKPVTLYPYSLISRHYRPETAGFYILHEGLIGVMGDNGLKEIGYKDIAEKKTETFKATSGWLGITDKYWATALIPNQSAPYEAFFQQFPASGPNARETFQTLFLLSPVTVAPGAKQADTSMLFAGAKQVDVIDAYKAKYDIKLFEKMIDWGWFPFLTKPLFHALAFFFHFFGNFGVSILLVTVLVKGAFFPLANKSYSSMSKMKKLQPEMKRIQERYADDRMKQQQAMMELYKKEKVNPMAGCLPIVIQIPVFFALYKVIFVSIEMRHAPFFGWIQDLSAADPTSIFNLFGLIPWTPPQVLMIGVWPIIMGMTMWVQMKLNPSAPDPIQQRIFTWMPVFFTYLLCSFPAGLVIYWTWNNLLSVLQQWVIMRRQGVEVNLLENMGLAKLMSKVASKVRPAE